MALMEKMNDLFYLNNKSEKTVYIPSIPQIKNEFENLKKTFSPKDDLFHHLRSYKNLYQFVVDKIGINNKYFQKSQTYISTQRIQEIVINSVNEILHNPQIISIQNPSALINATKNLKNKYHMIIQFGHMMELVIIGDSLEKVIELISMLYNQSVNFRLNLLKHFRSLKPRGDGIKRYQIITGLSTQKNAVDFDIIDYNNYGHFQIFAKDRYQQEDFITKNIPILLERLLSNVDNHKAILDEMRIKNEFESDFFSLSNVFEC